MSINIRVAEKKNCIRLMELVHELAVYEKLPEEVTAIHFHEKYHAHIESGWLNASFSTEQIKL